MPGTPKEKPTRRCAAANQQPQGNKTAISTCLPEVFNQATREGRRPLGQSQDEAIGRSLMESPSRQPRDWGLSVAVMASRACLLFSAMRRIRASHLETDISAQLQIGAVAVAVLAVLLVFSISAPWSCALPGQSRAIGITQAAAGLPSLPEASIVGPGSQWRPPSLISDGPPRPLPGPAAVGRRRGNQLTRKRGMRRAALTFPRGARSQPRRPTECAAAGGHASPAHDLLDCWIVGMREPIIRGDGNKARGTERSTRFISIDCPKAPRLCSPSAANLGLPWFLFAAWHESTTKKTPCNALGDVVRHRFLQTFVQGREQRRDLAARDTLHFSRFAAPTCSAAAASDQPQRIRFHQALDH